MSNVIQHTTIEGQRWDNVSVEFYGSVDKIGDLIEANPTVPIYDIFPSGVVLDIPIIERVQVMTDAEKLPPWKQG